MKKIAILGLWTVLVSTLFAEGPVPKGVPHLDHVFLIMMENHAYAQIVGNPDPPYLLKSANSAANYFAIGHPSSTNYLGSGRRIELRGAQRQQSRLAQWQLHPQSHFRHSELRWAGISGAVCPISGTGTDAETPALDLTNECTAPCPRGLINIDGSSIPAGKDTVGKRIADQLVAAGLSWKSHQESLPPTERDQLQRRLLH